MIPSAERIHNWRSQFQRVERWLGRLCSPRIDEMSDTERLDFYLAFFMNCYALRDWILKSGAASKADMDALIASNQSIRLCRDICNRSKHLTIGEQASVDADYQIHREYIPYEKKTRWCIRANGEKRELFSVASECMDFWRAFLKNHDRAQAGH